MNMNLKVCDEVIEIAHRSHYLARPLISQMQQSCCTLLMKNSFKCERGRYDCAM